VMLLTEWVTRAEAAYADADRLRAAAGITD